MTVLATAAKLRLKKLGYNNIEIRGNDGFYGWPEKAPLVKEANVGTS